MITSPNLSLTIWNLTTDPYDSNQVAANWAKVDQHDHTPGRGVPIGTAALADGSITSSKLAPGVINAQAIPDGSITAAKLQPGIIAPGSGIIQNGAITEPLLDGTILPVGTVMQWWRPDTGTAYPGQGGTPTAGGWVTCDGSTYGPAVHSFTTSPVGQSITVPNMQNKFVLGGSSTGVSNPTTAQVPAIGATGGAHTKNLAHTHGMSHVHGYSNIDHTHTYGIPNHQHEMFQLKPAQVALGGSGYYAFPSTGFSDGNAPGWATTSGMIEAAGFYPTTTIDGGAGFALTGTDSIGGVTGSSGSTTQDIRAGFVGLLYIIKIKHG